MTGNEHFYFDWQFFIYSTLVLGWLFRRKNYQFRLKRQTKLPECTSRSNQWLVPLIEIPVHHWLFFFIYRLSQFIEMTTTMSKNFLTKSIRTTTGCTIYVQKKNANTIRKSLTGVSAITLLMTTIRPISGNFKFSRLFQNVPKLSKSKQNSV